LSRRRLHDLILHKGTVLVDIITSEAEPTRMMS